MNALKRLLNVYWLRPESALWRAIDIEILKNIKFKKPVLDLGCGDGIFSFILQHGDFDESFDVYKYVDNKENYCPRIFKSPKIKYDYGIDIKKSHILKAAKLNFYDELIHGPAERVPLPPEHVNTIFSNIIHWVSDLDAVLGECHRLLNKGGRCIFTLPNDKFKKMLTFHKDKGVWGKTINQGRYNCYIHCHSIQKWEEIFKKVGFKVLKVKEYMPENIIRLWDIGTRYTFPLMFEKMSQLALSERSMAKKVNIAFFESFFKGMLNEKSNKFGFILFELQKM